MTDLNFSYKPFKQDWQPGWTSRTLKLYYECGALDLPAITYFTTIPQSLFTMNYYS